MKYGITQWSFPNGLYAFRFAAEAGYEGVQLETGLDTTGYYMRDKAMQRIYLEESKRQNVEIISIVDNDMMYVGCQGDKDGEEYKKSIRAIQMTIDTCLDLGCKRFMLPMFFRSQIYSDRPRTYDRAVEVLQFACRRAQDAGLVVQVETSIPAKLQLKLMQDVDMPNLVNFYDTQNLYWYDGLDALKELPALMPVNGPEMHICDGWGMMSKDTNGAQLLGYGDAHIAEQMKVICGYGWDGWLIMENGYHLPSLRDKGSFVELAKRDLDVCKAWVAQYSNER